MDLALADTEHTSLAAVLALEANPDVAPWISAWPLERHERAIFDPDEAHLTFLDAGRFAGFVLLAGLSHESRSVELRRIVLYRRGAGLGPVALDLTPPPQRLVRIASAYVNYEV
ncbi:MAG TPA: hypothetical protein VF927_10460 [Solirubrobacteraceae bacterium]